MNVANLKESPLVSGAEEVTRPTRWWWGYLFSLVLLFIVGAIVSLIVGAFFTVEPKSMSAQFNEGAVSLGTLLALALWVHFKEGRPVSSLGFRGSGALGRLGLGILIGAGMMTLSVIILLILDQYHQNTPSAGTVVGWSALIPFFILLLGHWLFQASMEETVFRGYLTQIGTLHLPGWLAILLPGLIFSGLHFITEGLSQPIAGINILLLPYLPSSLPCDRGRCGWLVVSTSAGTGFRVTLLACRSAAPNRGMYRCSGWHLRTMQPAG